MQHFFYIVKRTRLHHWQHLIYRLQNKLLYKYAVCVLNVTLIQERDSIYLPDYLELAMTWPYISLIDSCVVSRSIFCRVIDKCIADVIKCIRRKGPPAGDVFWCYCNVREIAKTLLSTRAIIYEFLFCF